MEERSSFSLSLMNRCNTVLKHLMNHRYGYVFNAPVDPVALGIPHYFQIIKDPMDLGTIKSKLRDNIYSSPHEFAADVRLTFDNALKFNPIGDPVHDMAETLSRLFESKWKGIQKKTEEVGGKRSNLKEEDEDDKTRVRVFGRPPVRKEMPKISYDKLMYIVRKFEEWSTDVPEPIVDFVKKYRTDLCRDEDEDEDDDEMQLDMNMLRNNELWELYDLVAVSMDRKPSANAVGGGETSRATESGDHMDEKNDY